MRNLVVVTFVGLGYMACSVCEAVLQTIDKTIHPRRKASGR